MASETRCSDYYKGSEEAATETALTIDRLEQRRALTRNSKRLVIALVGLPGRGKSFVARKLHAFLTWIGVECKIFNVGKYRREAAAILAHEKANSRSKGTDRDEAGSCGASFFDDSNTEAAKLRERVAEVALRDMLNWLDDEDEDEGNSRTFGRQGSGLSTSSLFGGGRGKHERIAIFDATNSTVKRRTWILEECTSREKRPDKPTGVVFLESICDDEELLEENFRYKVQHSPDFIGMSEEEALLDLRKRSEKYEERYETVDDDTQSYIKVFNLSTKLLVNHCYGRMAKIIIPAIMAWNIGSRPILMCRPGRTHSSICTDEEGYVSYVNEADPTFLDLSSHTRRSTLRGDSLGKEGLEFSLALKDFIENENDDFIARRSDASSSETGTSLTGLAPWEKPFPTVVLTSTMPRAVQTCHWAREYDCVEQLSNLNPLDKGDFMGLELDHQIQEIDPDWYDKLMSDPFNTRFPGGESYSDLIHRLESIIIDMEQQVAPVLIISHLSVLQLLVAYMRNSPVDKAMSIDVPMHTVLKFTPSRGGGWSETRHKLLPEDDDEVIPVAPVTFDSDHGSPFGPGPSTPIWSDPVRRQKYGFGSREL